MRALNKKSIRRKLDFPYLLLTVHPLLMLFSTELPKTVKLTDVVDIRYGPFSQNFLKAYHREPEGKIRFATCITLITTYKTLDIMGTDIQTVIATALLSAR